MDGGEAGGYGGWPWHKLGQRLRLRVGTRDGLASLEAELQVGQPLLVLLARHVYPGLLAGVELSVADPAEVLQSAGQRHPAAQTSVNTNSVIITAPSLLNSPQLSGLAAGIGIQKCVALTSDHLLPAPVIQVGRSRSHGLSWMRGLGQS